MEGRGRKAQPSIRRCLLSQMICRDVRHIMFSPKTASVKSVTKSLLYSKSPGGVSSLLLLLRARNTQLSQHHQCLRASPGQLSFPSSPSALRPGTSAHQHQHSVIGRHHCPKDAWLDLPGADGLERLQFGKKGAGLRIRMVAGHCSPSETGGETTPPLPLAPQSGWPPLLHHKQKSTTSLALLVNRHWGLLELSISVTTTSW